MTPDVMQGAVNYLVGSVKLEPVTAKAVGDIPALRPYDFAMMEGQLLIVNPSDRKIVAVITR